MIAGKMNCTHSGLWKIEGMRDCLSEMKIFQSMSLLGLTHFFTCLFYFIAS